MNPLPLGAIGTIVMPGPATVLLGGIDLVVAGVSGAVLEFGGAVEALEAGAGGAED